MVKEDPVSVDVKEESKKQRKDSVKKRKKKDKHKKKKAKRSKLSSSSSATLTPKGYKSDSLQRQVEEDEKEEDANPPLVSSWGQAFAAASSVQPLSLGDDFTQIEEASHATSVTATGFRGNISLISQIAKEATSQQLAEQETMKQPESMPPAKKKKPKKKKSKKDPSVHKSTESTTPGKNKPTFFPLFFVNKYCHDDACIEAVTLP
jgi:hypothetical protein